MGNGSQVRPCALRLAAGTVALLLTFTAAPRAQVDARAQPPDEDRFLNAPVPDIDVTTAAGETLAISEVARGEPLVLGFVFTRCAGVCSPFLRAWRAADSSVAHRTAFHRLVLSFDPRDSVADMAALAGHVGAEGDPRWTFAIATPENVRRLADATGFWYDWSEPRLQFDHPAMLAGIRGGRLVRLLIGGSISSGRLDELVREASGEFVASYPLPGRVLFRCVQFDAGTRRLTLDWGFAMLLVPVGVTLVATLAMFVAGAGVRASRDEPQPLDTRAGSE
jgi:protein SCO1/2